MAESGRMPHLRWIKSTLVMFVAGVVILLTAALLRDRPLRRAVSESIQWAAVSAAVFIGTRLYWSRQGRSCALCGDRPETADAVTDIPSQRRVTSSTNARGQQAR